MYRVFSLSVCHGNFLVGRGETSLVTPPRPSFFDGNKRRLPVANAVAETAGPEIGFTNQLNSSFEARGPHWDAWLMHHFIREL